MGRLHARDGPWVHSLASQIVGFLTGKWGTSPEPHEVLWAELCLQDPYVEALTPRISECHCVWREVIMVQPGGDDYGTTNLSGDLEKEDTDPPRGRPCKDTAVYRPRTEASGEPTCAVPTAAVTDQDKLSNWNGTGFLSCGSGGPKSERVSQG